MSTGCEPSLSKGIKAIGQAAVIAETLLILAMVIGLLSGGVWFAYEAGLRVRILDRAGCEAQWREYEVEDLDTDWCFHFWSELPESK